MLLPIGYLDWRVGKNIGLIVFLKVEVLQALHLQQDHQLNHQDELPTRIIVVLIGFIGLLVVYCIICWFHH